MSLPLSPGSTVLTFQASCGSSLRRGELPPVNPAGQEAEICSHASSTFRESTLEVRVGRGLIGATWWLCAEQQVETQVLGHTTNLWGGIGGRDTDKADLQRGTHGEGVLVTVRPLKGRKRWTAELVSATQPVFCNHSSGRWINTIAWPTLYDPVDCSTPGLPVHHQLPEFTQTHVHWVGDVTQPSHPLSPPSRPALNLSQHQGLFQWVSSSHQMANVLQFQLQHPSFQWTPRTDLL